MEHKNTNTHWIQRPWATAGFVFLSMVLASTLGVNYFYQKTLETKGQAFKKDLMNLVATAATTIDIDLHETFITANQTSSPSYLKAIEPLVQIHNAVPHIYYLYTIRLRGDEQYFVLDTATQKDRLNIRYDLEASEVNELYSLEPSKNDKAMLANLRQFKRHISDEPYSDDYGTFITGSAPLVDGSGKLIGYLGIDYETAKYEAEIAEIVQTRNISTLIGFLTALLLGSITYRIQKSIRSKNKALTQLNTKLEETLETEKELTRKANAANRSKSEFLATMSHEIRTPMNGVLGLTSLLLSTELDEEQKDILLTIQKSGDSLLAIINDILDLSRIEKGDLELEDTTFDLIDIVHEVSDLNYVQAQEKSLPIILDIDTHAHQCFNGDPLRIKQILTNIVNNAVKFTDKGSVTLSLKTNKISDELYEVVFRIKDTGIGIEKEKLKTIFNPFTQGDSSTTRKYGGTGLGLCICKKTVEILDGTIDVESKVGEGSKFTVTLKLHSAQDCTAINVESDNTIKAIEQGGGVKILVADDNKSNLRVIELFLNKLDLRADYVCNGKQALDKHIENNYEIILMDVQMPEMDGIDATKLIREFEAKSETTSPVTIIALTAFAMSTDKERCLDAGMNDYLTKPLKIKALRNAIEKRLRVLT